MFESANLEELAKLLQSVITPQVVGDGKMWKLTDPTRHKIRLAMFGRGRPSNSLNADSPAKQSELLSQFTAKVAGPMIERLPPHTAAWGVLMLYEEFVNVVFVNPFWESEVGGGD